MPPKISPKRSKKEHPTEDEIVVDEEFEEETGTTDKLKELREKLKECQAEKMEYLTGWQRAKADYANQSGEHARALEASRRHAKTALLEDLLPALDSFTMAMNGNGWQLVDATWRTGVEHIHRQLMAALADNGFTMIDPINEPFDPARHQAIETREVDDVSRDHMIIEVLQKGYALGEHVVRPARVVVGTFSQ